MLKYFFVFLLLNKEQSQFDSNRLQRKQFQIFHDILKNLLIDLYWRFAESFFALLFLEVAINLALWRLI